MSVVFGLGVVPFTSSRVTATFRRGSHGAGWCHDPCSAVRAFCGLRPFSTNGPKAADLLKEREVCATRSHFQELQLQFQADICRLEGMGQSSNRNEVHSGQRVFADITEMNTS